MGRLLFWKSSSTPCVVWFTSLQSETFIHSRIAKQYIIPLAGCQETRQSNCQHPFREGASPMGRTHCFCAVRSTVVSTGETAFLTTRRSIARSLYLVKRPFIITKRAYFAHCNAVLYFQNDELNLQFRQTIYHHFH